MVWLYNLLMLLVVGTALLCAARRPTRWNVLLAVLAAGACAVGLTAVLAGPSFLGMRLLAWGLFGHVAVVLAGAALLLRRNHRRAALVPAAGTVLLAIVAADAFLIEPVWLEVSHVRIVSEKLQRPLRIAVLADLQTDRIGRHERHALRRLMDEKPDVILLTGDYVQIERHRLAALRQRLRQALVEVGFGAPLGAYAVQGDCERDGWQQIFAGLPVQTFERTSTLSLPDLELTALPLRASADTRLQVGRRPRFHVVFGHRPDFALGQVEADLLVAGHTHGGQVRLPGLGPLITMSHVPRAWAAGVTALPGGRTLVVSRGVGMERADAPRLRFLCRPELLILDLVPAQPTGRPVPLS